MGLHLYPVWCGGLPIDYSDIPDVRFYIKMEGSRYELLFGNYIRRKILFGVLAEPGYPNPHFPIQAVV